MTAKNENSQTYQNRNYEGKQRNPIARNLIENQTRVDYKGHVLQKKANKNAYFEVSN